MGEIGEGETVQTEFEFHWQIKDFFSISQRGSIWYWSPSFDFDGETWYLGMHPNGAMYNKSLGNVGLQLFRRTYWNPTSTVKYSMGLKTVTGKKVGERYCATLETFNKGGFRGFPEFMSRSELLRRKDELVPSGVLTVVCTLSPTESVGSLGRMNQDFKEVFLNGNISDVVLKAKDQESRDHRCIMASRSPNFLTVIMHNTREEVAAVVDIQDVDRVVFADFINYLYTKRLENLTSESALKLYAIAGKYKIFELKELCSDYMMTNISIHNFCDVYTLSLLHDEIYLEKKCVDFFAANSLEITLTPKWQKFLSENPVKGNELFIKHLQLNK